MDGTLPSAIEALSRRILGSAVRANRSGFERIKRLTTLRALPVRSDRRTAAACGASEARPPRQLRNLKQGSGMLKASPTIQQNEDGKSCIPYRSLSQRESDESEDTEQAKDSGDHQAASAPNHKPEQTSQDLTAVEWVNWQDVESEQEEVDVENRPQ